MNLTLEGLSDFIKGNNIEDFFEHDSTFFSNKTEFPAKGGKLVYMTCEEYFNNCMKIQKYKGTINEYMKDAANPKLIEKYAQLMQNGEKFPLPYLTKDSQEGRNRVMAAFKAGAKEIPIIIIEGQSF